MIGTTLSLLMTLKYVTMSIWRKLSSLFRRVETINTEEEEEYSSTDENNENDGGQSPAQYLHIHSSEGKKAGDSTTMYGMLLESVQHFIQLTHGKNEWNKVLEQVGLRNAVFTTHRVYDEENMIKIAQTCSKLFGDKTADGYMSYFGKCFVEYFSHYGYDKILRVAGRHYRDFLNGIDNLHETMRFSFPNLQSPSFYVESEDKNGCVLVYRSKRKGYKHYVIGQLKQCALIFYDVNVDVTTLHENFDDDTYSVTYRLDFDNIAFVDQHSSNISSSPSEFADLSSNVFFKIFPFCILFDSDLIIRHTGEKLPMLLSRPTLIGSYLPSTFRLRRPLVEMTWQNMNNLHSVMFELEYVRRVQRSSFVNLLPQGSLMDNLGISPSSVKDLGTGHNVLLRGQMKLMTDWDLMGFLCTPLIGSLDDMRDFNLFLNDLSLYDNSREMVLAGWQHASTLECSIDQQINKCQKISSIMTTLDEWQSKSNSLLYSMIPKAIAERLKSGDDPITTCETFDEVTILFSYVVGFTDICARATPMQIVQCITDVSNTFDCIVDEYDCFKVETLGDAVYMVAGGVPDRRPNHAKRVANLSLKMMERAKLLKDPISGKDLQLRIGMHTGSVVGGVVGRRMPQYCLFGDTVNTASRMQSYSQPGRIHLSEPCHKCLDGEGFITVFRGNVNIKGKGEMKTFWLCGKVVEGRSEPASKQILDKKIESSNRIYRSFENGFDFHGMHTVTSGLFFTTNFEDKEEQNTTVTKYRQKRSMSLSAITKLTPSSVLKIDRNDTLFERKIATTKPNEQNKTKSSVFFIAQETKDIENNIKENSNNFNTETPRCPLLGDIILGDKTGVPSKFLSSMCPKQENRSCPSFQRKILKDSLKLHSKSCPALVHVSEVNGTTGLCNGVKCENEDIKGLKGMKTISFDQSDIKKCPVFIASLTRDNTTKTTFRSDNNDPKVQSVDKIHVADHNQTVTIKCDSNSNSEPSLINTSALSSNHVACNDSHSLMNVSKRENIATHSRTLLETDAKKRICPLTKQEAVIQTTNKRVFMCKESNL